MSEHAISNAKMHYNDMLENWSIASHPDTTDEKREQCEEAMRESALSVEVRSPWYGIDQIEIPPPSEFRIVLSMGGPALQLRGELDAYGEPKRYSLRLEWQDWDTRWTEFQHYHTGPATFENWKEYLDVLHWFVGLFYYGEG